MRLRLSILAGWLFALCLTAQEPIRCVSCREILQGGYYTINVVSLAEKQPLCKACLEITDRCALCGLPDRAGGRKLDDGRMLCERDFNQGVFQERDALDVFENVRREMLRVFAGTGSVPNRSVSVSLVDGREIAKWHQRQHSVHEDALTMGLTRTTRSLSGEYRHQIFLLSGLGRSRMMAVSAHEYTHAWVNENMPADRRLLADTVEGFCELVAYRLMGQLHEDLEQKVILANNYTRGQVQALLKADDDYRFYEIVDWIKSGVDASFSSTNTSRLLAVHTPSDSSPIVWSRPQETRVPAELELKGISGPSLRRFALVNDTTLVVNEARKVRVGDTNIFVRCVAISGRSVSLRVGNPPRDVELFLRDR